MIYSVVLGAAIGVAAGVGGFTFVYAKGGSYFTKDPAACVNCHVMRDQYAGWIKSSHRLVAACNDCHTPPSFIGKYTTKAINGFWHSYAFTTGHFHEPIQIGKRNREVTEKACRHCHQEIVQAIDGPHRKSAKLSCLDCHRSVGHLH